MSSFKFEEGQSVQVTETGGRGRVIGRRAFPGSASAYLIRLNEPQEAVSGETWGRETTPNDVWLGEGLIRVAPTN